MESEIKSWLKIILNEDVENFSLNILGNSEKGDGYLGDIIFVSLTPITNEPSNEYNLVIKCSKRSEALRKVTPVKEAFLNEIYVYDTILPAFTQFQLEKGISNPFDSTPKCYGTLKAENMEVIVFDDMKKSDYGLWGKEKPWSRRHIDLVIREYAKLHSISIAMKDQKPKEFEEMCEPLTDIFRKFVEQSDLDKVIENCIDEIHDVLKDDLDESLLVMWKTFKNKTLFILTELADEVSGTKVVLHGDGWGNNFLFKTDIENGNLPVKVGILDWQITRYSSPVFDLSHFLFAGISEEDIEDIDKILEKYYNDLKTFTANLGSDLDTLYPRSQFWIDWKKYCKFGITMSSLIHKVSATDKSEVIDIAQATENVGDFGAAFAYEVKNKAALKRRARHVVKYVVENKLID